MKWDDSGWYKWNESEMKYISQVKEPEEDIGEWNRLRGKWFKCDCLAWGEMGWVGHECQWGCN